MLEIMISEVVTASPLIIKKLNKRLVQRKVKLSKNHRDIQLENFHLMKEKNLFMPGSYKQIYGKINAKVEYKHFSNNMVRLWMFMILGIFSLDIFDCDSRRNTSESLVGICGAFVSSRYRLVTNSFTVRISDY